MIDAAVRVVAVQDGRALVQATQQSGCGACSSREACGVSGLGKYFSGSRKTIAVTCDANVKAGDELQITLPESDLLKAGLLAYLLPTVLALVGAGIASGYGDVAAVAGAAGGVALGFLLGRVSGWMPQMSVKNER